MLSAFPAGKALYLPEVFIMNEERLFHLDLPSSLRVGYAILPGDPGRVDKIAEHLSSPELAGCNREFRSVIGMLDGERVIVTSTGIGGPSAAIALEELARIGVHHAIRTGTSGGIQLVVFQCVAPNLLVEVELTHHDEVAVLLCALKGYTEQLRGVVVEEPLHASDVLAQRLRERTLHGDVILGVNNPDAIHGHPYDALDLVQIIRLRLVQQASIILLHLLVSVGG